MPISSIMVMRSTFDWGCFTSRCACIAPCRRREGAERPGERSQSFGCPVERDAKRGGDARAIGGIGLGAVGDMALFDFDARVTDGAGGVLEQKPLLFGTHP